MSANIYSKPGADAAFATKATQTTVESGRLSAATLGTSFAAKSAQDTVESGRLSPGRVSRSARSAGKSGSGMICMIFDDNWANQYTFGLPAVEAIGGRVTLATNSSTWGGSNRFTSAQVLDAFGRGHEIANHTLTHLDMTTLTAAQRADEWDTAQAAITSLIGQPATSFIYPYNKTTLAIDQQNYLRYDRAFAGNNIPFLEPINDRDTFLHGRWSWSNDTSSIHSRALNFVRMAAVSDVVFTIFCHQIIPTTSANDGNISEANFTELLNLADSLGVPIVPANVAFPRFNRLPDAGMESTNTLYHVVSGTNAMNTYTSVVESPMANYYAGTRFKRFTGDGTATLIDMQDVYLPVRSSEPQTISAEFRQSRTSGSGSGLVVQEFDTYGTQIGSNILSTAITSNMASWTQVTLDYTPSATARSFRIGWYQSSMVGTTDCDHMAVDLKRRPALG